MAQDKFDASEFGRNFVDKHYGKDSGHDFDGDFDGDSIGVPTTPPSPALGDDGTFDWDKVLSKVDSPIQPTGKLNKFMRYAGPVEKKESREARVSNLESKFGDIPLSGSTEHKDFGIGE